MSVIANRRSVMTLFSDVRDIYSHRVRFVLAEKGINFEIYNVDPDNKPEDLAELNPYNNVPTLVDRDLVLYNSLVIMEYLDERFPHPPLMPVDPVSRARIRLMINRIEQDLFQQFDIIEHGSEKAATKARKTIAENLIQINPIFEHKPFFLSDEISLADCCLVPLLLRLNTLRVNVPKKYTGIWGYATRLFEREGFRSSLSEQEKEMLVE